jgi:hypothetical protein
MSRENVARLEAQPGRLENVPDFARNRGIGWEAGIRTPITASRAPCPTVERPPSIVRVPRPTLGVQKRRRPRAGTIDCTEKKRLDATHAGAA